MFDRENLLPFIRIGVFVVGVLLLAIVVSRLVYPFCSGTWESMNWMPATHLLAGKNPYAYAFSPPYSMLPYGIVYYGLIAVGVELFGLQMWFGRLLSVVAFGVCIWIVFKIAKRLTKSKEAAWLACLAGLAMFPAQMWISIMRPDLVATAFALAAFYLAFTLEEDEKTPPARFVLIVLFSLAAFFTKQTLLLAVGFVFLRFLQLKKWREAVLFPAAFAISAFSTMFLLNYTSSGGYFWQHFTHAQRLPLNFAKAAGNFAEMLQHPTFVFAIIFVLVFVSLNRKNLTRFDVRSRTFLVALYFAGSLGWAFLSAGRQGGGANYYIENSFLMAIVVALVYDRFKRNWALAMIVLLALGGVFQQVRILRGEYGRWQARSYYREMFETIGRTIPPGGECVSIYPELVAWNGCRFNFDDFEEYDGTWSPELIEIFEREIRAGRFAAIVWYDDKLQAKFPNYRLVPMSEKVPERYYPAYLYLPEK